MKMILLGLVLTFQYERFYSWAQAEKIIEESGIPITFIRPNFFMQYFVNFYLGKNQSSIYLPAGCVSYIVTYVCKPINQSILGEKSGPPAWKQLPTWYQISEGDHMIPPDAERLSAKQMNATTISINSSHASPVSHPDETAQLILNATKGH